MKIKKVLLVTPYFAPQTHAAMFRVYKLARYLPKLGYQVHVLTVDTNYLYNEDDSLLKQLPEGVVIHTAKYTEPTLRGLKMKLGGEDRTFAALKRKAADDSAQGNAPSSPNPMGSSHKRGLVQRLKLWMANRPDRYWTWYKHALAKATSVIQTHNIDVVYTTTAPYTTLRLGMALQSELGVKWVADYRDPLGYSERFSQPGAKVQAEEKRIVKAAMRKADHVVGLARSYEYIFSDLYQLSSNRFTFIPTGADDAYIEAAHAKLAERSTTDITVLFVGEFLDEYDSNHVFRALDQAGLQLDGRLKLKVIGRREVNQHRVERLLNSACCDYLKLHCEFIDHIPQAQLYEEIAAAQACLLIPGNSLWWTNFAKLVDYIALQKTVIADVPLISEARLELTKAGLGVFLGGDLIEDTTELLKILERPNQRVNKNYCQLYLASSQVAAFAKVFDQQLEHVGR
ncbi:glycosyltransferase [Alteromonas sp. ASW11-36]|uniref:Glycosyltransferase n=1 Tax=Alteromonas arenosi TaxID=3055817 RepID=A0ABT7SYY0_9ALTE|nr:glycosyltransferase [Alteromonas sp. ASW11-36]MDM7861403.1 glycosyltransferase [Alteromonas sp. ASW11-36]